MSKKGHNLKIDNKAAFPFTSKQKALLHAKNARKNGHKVKTVKFKRIYFNVKR